MTNAVQTKLDALYAITRAVAGGEFRARMLLQRVSDAVSEALEFERVAIFRYMPETDSAVPFTAHGADEADLVRLPPAVPLARLPIFGEARSSGRATFSRDAAEDGAVSEFAVTLLGLRSLVVVPLMSDARCLGFLTADRGGREFVLDDDELELLNAIGTFTAVFLEKAIEQSELRRLNELKSQFIALASHELRTPAATIYGISETLESRWDKLSDEHRTQLREVLYQQAERLRRLVEQLLDLSRVEAGAAALVPERFAVKARLEDLVAAVAAEHSGDVALDVPDGLEAVVDAEVLERIVSNLLSNALRYGEPPVTVRARAADSALEVAVEDAGTGVPPEFVPNLFERFARATTTHAVSGAGLGLAIAQSYAHAHGGRIVYEDAAPRGARFRVTLPTGRRGG